MRFHFRFRVFILLMAAVFVVGTNASSAAAQDMPGMKMPMPKAKPKVKVNPKLKTKAASKQKSKTASKAKPSPKTTPKAKPKAKPMEMNMPSPSQTQTPKPAPTQTPMPMDMKMPTPSPSSSPMPMDMPMNMPMPSPTPVASHAMPMASPTPMPMHMPMATPTPTTRDTSSEQKENSARLFPPPKDWPMPVHDQMRHTFVLADILEFRPNGSDSDVRWDTEGWYGGDYNRLWFKSEGEQSTTKAQRDLDFQLLYARFVKRYYDFQIGGRVETKTFRGASVTRGHLVIGIEGLVPYRYELESALFISHQGDVSGRVSFTRDYLLTQRWIFQPRFETNIAAQRVERFGIGRGLNDIELGLRLRYEIRREFAPYIGISYDRKLFETAKFVRQDGGNPSQVRFVMGVRLWH